MDKNRMTPGMRVHYSVDGVNATYVGPERPNSNWALIIRDDGVKGCGPKGEYAVFYNDLSPIQAPVYPPFGIAPGVPAPTPVTNISVWHAPFQIGDRVLITDECEGQIISFDFKCCIIEVARDDDMDGSGSWYTSLRDGKEHQSWICTVDELQLLTSGTSIPGEGMSEPSAHKMGLDPETIDWSKFKKIQDML